VYSGGMDSTTLLHQFKGQIALAVSFDYGSKHNNREYEYAKLNTEKLGIEHIRINLRDFMKSFKSALTNPDIEIPEGHYAEDNMASTVVPFRNGIMLSIAAGIAESKGIPYILIANHFGDDAQYPDCRQQFIVPMDMAVQAGTGGKVCVLAPYTAITKKDIAQIGYSLNLDWQESYSCYKGEEFHCGKCGTCVERIWALRHVGDTTIYKDRNYAIKALNDKGEW
jgi:7-cyano-7-deazaguanine synthase